MSLYNDVGQRVIKKERYKLVTLTSLYVLNRQYFALKHGICWCIIGLKDGYKMIKNSKLINQFERDVIVKNSDSFNKKLKLMDAMYMHAKKLHDFTKDDFSVCELEHIVRYSKVLKSV